MSGLILVKPFKILNVSIRSLCKWQAYNEGSYSICNLSSYGNLNISPISFVSLCCTHSSPPSSKVTKLECSIQGEGEHKFCIYKKGSDCWFIYLKVLLIRPRDLNTLEVALWHCNDELRVLVHHMPKSFSSMSYLKQFFHHQIHLSKYN